MTHILITAKPGAALPQYARPGDSGMDLHADFDGMLLPGARCLVTTGLHIALPDGFEAQVRPRSGLALKHGVTVLNAPGTIDSGYRGEIGAILINHGHKRFDWKAGDRIAQLVVAPVTRVTWKQVGELPESVRDIGGFGSSGS